MGASRRDGTNTSREIYSRAFHFDPVAVVRQQLLIINNTTCEEKFMDEREKNQVVIFFNSQPGFLDVLYFNVFRIA